MSIFNRKKPLIDFYGKCFLCNRNLDKNYSSLAFESESGDAEEYGRICTSCAEKLEEMESRQTTSDGIEIIEDDE